MSSESRLRKRAATRGRVGLVIAVSMAAVLTLVLVAALSACTKQAANEVIVKDLRFSPKTLTVSVGTTVTWKNEDQTAHTITSDSNDDTTAPEAQRFSSDPLSPGDTYSHTFDTAGTYKYHCSIHPYIQGEIIVR